MKVALMGHMSNAQAQAAAMDTRDMVNHIQDVVSASAEGVARLQEDDDVSHLLVDLGPTDHLANISPSFI